MSAPIDILLLRDPREPARKCSLTPLRGRPGITFRSWRPDRRFAVGHRILLHPSGTLLNRADAGPGLLLIDCAWRRVPAVLATLDGDLIPRRLPPLHTAYPRRSKLFADPDEGLASVEALFAALSILGERREDLLAGYRFKAPFLERNPALA